MTVQELNDGKVEISVEILQDLRGANFVAYCCSKEELNDKISVYPNAIKSNEFFLRFQDSTREKYIISEKEHRELKQYLKSLKNYKPTEEELLMPRKIINPIFELEI